ncbi:TPA: molecular chaperone DnaJ [Salmonella enterica]|nr:molecular chaperone DnaJ [Salmonella enterica]EBS1968331.1 molecular chaperone DnaJ [Salmonella enterica subsp. enterica serovar Poona]EDH8145575.1 molecular chaperone DnaJ [Salmonella enterica subsp. enterica serovar Larochelle]EHV9800654.1 molecular chaperone DnaJ [Salmonella enterica subsp. enterica serovar Senftenberg]EBT3729969.1 molecular chaperone DnaJ [Salmonella enterica]
MTTITREQQKQILIDTANHVISRDNTSPYSENLRELARIALAALTAEPVRYLNKFSGVCVTLEQQPNAADDVAVYMPLYAAPPVQETGIYKDMLNIISLLEKNEWAEHCTSTVLGSLLESEITRLVSKEQPTPIVPESISVRQAISALESADSVTTIGQAYKMGWNACRAAMLQGVEQPQNARQNIPENIPDGNSPAIPDDWVMVPKKLTAENGAKSLLSGEFLETTFISCPECFADEECESCDGSGRIKIEVPVSWTTIKAIWNKGVEHFRSSTATGDN